MNGNAYNVVFRGEYRPDHDPGEVRAKVSRLLKVDQARVEELFAGKTIILKGKVTKEDALRLKGIFDSTGGICHVEPVEAAPAPVSSPLPPPRETVSGPPATPPPVAAADFSCPKCGFMQEKGPSCVKCGVYYAKISPGDAVTLRVGSGPEMPPVAMNISLPDIEADDARLELKLRWFALPVALVVAWAMAHSGFRFFLRTFLSMWVHETGHAVAAWLSGFPAFPGPWFTPVFEDRSILITVVVGCTVGWFVYRTWIERRPVLAVAGVVVLLAQAVCTLLPAHRVQAFIIFSGDGGCFVLGMALMASFYTRRDSRIFQDGLRWGFLGIGSAAFMDAARTWWGALRDVDQIPFGENVGVTLSDPTKLIEVHRWSLADMVHRYEWLSLACLAVLAVAYVKGIMDARKWTGGKVPGAAKH